MAAVLVASQWWYGRMAEPPDPGTVADSLAVERADTLTAADAAGPGPAGADPVDADADPGQPGGAAATATDTVATGGTAGTADTTGVADTTAVPGALANELLAGGPAPSSVRVVTPLYEVRISPEGALLEQVELVRYPSFTIDSTAAILIPAGEAMLHRTADLGESRLRLDERSYAPSDSLITLAEGDSAATLELVWEGAGRRIVHRWRFVPDTYVVDYDLSLGGGDGVLVTGVAPRLFSNEKNPSDDYNQMRAVARVDGEVVSRSAGDVDEGETASLSGTIDWAGLKTKYFLGVVLAAPDGPGLTAVTMRGTTGDSLPRLDVAVATPIENGDARYRLFFGPQEYRRLSALNDGLDEVSQYGWSFVRWMITPFAKWIVVIMLWMHQFIPSYGLVLIVFGILVRLVMWPLTVKSYKSIQAMQKLQPEIQRIREKYKEDPQTMQQETMRLYKEKKVNPLGGCLPNLIPMPILFALFFVFQSTIELRNQPFLWLADLSQPDPIYVLPVLMGLTMFASSKMTATDPKMSAMTYVMPIVLTFVFLNLAAGLVLYYAFSNLLTFLQQYWLRRGMEAEERAEAEATGDDGGG